MCKELTYREYIGARIAELRKNAGLSIRDLADIAQLDSSNIGKIEKGRYSVGIDTLGKIADALNCKIEIVEKNDCHP